MTKNERDALMVFLRLLTQSKTSADDKVAETFILDAVRSQPNANYLLVQRALILEAQLARAHDRIEQLESGVSFDNSPAIASYDFLSPEKSSWGLDHQHGAGLSLDKRLLMLIQADASKRGKSVEAAGLGWIEKNNGKIWLFFALAFVVTYLVKQKAF